MAATKFRVTITCDGADGEEVYNFGPYDEDEAGLERGFTNAIVAIPDQHYPGETVTIRVEVMA